LPKPENTIKIRLDDEKYFDLFIGKRVLRKELISSTGEIPVFSANVKEPWGKLSDSNIENFDNDFVLWGIDGNWEFNVIKSNTMFRTTDHCGAIRIKQNSISAEYLFYYLNWIKAKEGLDRGLRASITNMKKLEVEFPVKVDDDDNPKTIVLTNEDGSSLEIFDLDFEIQIEISNFYQTFEEVKERITERIRELKTMEIPPLN